MTVKDWIILLVPLVINGVILFVFQQIFLNNQNKSKRRNDYQDKVLEEFLIKLQAFYSTYWSMQLTIAFDRFGTADWEPVWNKATEQIQELVLYFRAHPASLKKLQIKFDRCVNHWQMMIDLFANDMRFDEGVISNTTREILSKAYPLMSDYIMDCLAECESMLLN